MRKITIFWIILTICAVSALGVGIGRDIGIFPMPAHKQVIINQNTLDYIQTTGMSDFSTNDLRCYKKYCGYTIKWLENDMPKSEIRILTHVNSTSDSENITEAMNTDFDSYLNELEGNTPLIIEGITQIGVTPLEP